MSHDVVILGAGPAGVSAALEASRLGLTAAIVDEQPAAGGQVYRVSSPAIRNPKPSPGDALRAQLAASSVTQLFDHRVWLVEKGFSVAAIGPSGDTRLPAKALILATGAHERVAPIPGWTLPGVIGLAAATALIKAQAVLPGENVVVAGRGPLLLLVASLILKGGGKVACVVDANPASRWLAATPSLVSRPDLVAQGAGWLAQVVAAGVPIYFNSVLNSITGTTHATAVEIQQIFGTPRSYKFTIECDAVCYGDGLTPATELSRHLGARHAYIPDQGGWTVATDIDQRTDIGLFYACGDGAGVLGAAAAPIRGRIAALAAAHDLGRLSFDEHAKAAAPLRRQLHRASRFGAAMTALTAPSFALVAQTTPDTVVCRCESLTRAALDAAIDAGAASPNALKFATRCGMGPCGGRFCGDSAAALIAARTGRSLGDVGQMTGRPPLRPIRMDALMGDFQYSDLPFPEPAPL